MKKNYLFISCISVIVLINACGNKKPISISTNSKTNDSAQTEVTITDTTVLTVNSFELFEAYRIDRSLANKKYSNRILKITDLLLYNVYNQSDGYVKKIKAYGFNPKTMFISRYDQKNTYMGNELNNVPSGGTFNFDLEDPESIKSIAPLDWESVTDNEFNIVFDVKAVIIKKEFSPKTYVDDDLKTNWFNFTLGRVELIKKK